MLATLVLVGCGGSSDEGTSKQRVVAAFYPVAWAAEQIGGKDVEVVNLTSPGGEPHDIELSPSDLERIRDADLVLYLGRGFMPALEDAVRGRDNAVDLLAGQELRTGHDPHVWLEPMRYAEMVQQIGEALGHPGEGGSHVAELGLVVGLAQLDQELRLGLARCARREIVTSHAAFGYLADAYRLRQVALTGVSPEAEPSPRELEALVDEVKASGATTVFFETLVSPRLAETVAREAGVETAALNPLEGLTENELAAGEDYFTVMDANLAALRKALGCR